MKRTFIFLLLCCIMMSSCQSKDTNELKGERGIENYSEHNQGSSNDITCFLLPDEMFFTSKKEPDGAFLNKFAYREGNFFWLTTGSVLNNTEMDRSLIFLKYEENVYWEAKAYAFDNLILSEEPICEENGYKHFLNKTPSILRDDSLHHLSGKNFPHDFLTFSYNDEQMILVFLGFSVCSKHYGEVESVADDWPAFLEKYYGEWYSFS